MDTPTSLMNERVSDLCGLMGEMRQEMTEMKGCLAIVKTDVAWLKRCFWLPVGAACTALIGAGVAVLFR